MTSATNPWNETQNIAAGRRKQTAPTTTLRQEDGELTTNLQTLQYMIQKLKPEDNQNNDNATHKQIRATTQETIDKTDDKELSLQEVRNVVASMRRKKAPG